MHMQTSSDLLMKPMYALLKKECTNILPLIIQTLTIHEMGPP